MVRHELKEPNPSKQGLKPGTTDGAQSGGNKLKEPNPSKQGLKPQILLSEMERIEVLRNRIHQNKD